MADLSEIGRFGTLRLLKRHEPDTTVAVFPIDEEMVTFGRNKQCSVRLYYDCVSELHCTIQFSEERKAFLLVQGTNGLLVDGCQVNPTKTPGSNPTTVPLINGSEIEIYKKRFRFEYPPKEFRAALLATPYDQTPKSSRRSLRMSLIRSAQVLTPRLHTHLSGNDTAPRMSRRGSIRDNVEWEVLRSPVTVPGDGNGTQMMLLEGHGDDAVVVEEEKDLIILEPVENKSSEAEQKQPAVRATDHAMASSTQKVSPTSQPTPVHLHREVSPMRTPTQPHRRRSAASLHRAVVLRSAQRAQLERERFEDRQEEEEVEAVVSPDREFGAAEVDDDDDEYGGPDVSPNMPLTVSKERVGVFRASLDAVKKALPLPFNWRAPEEVPLPPEEQGEGHELQHEVEEDDDDDDDDVVISAQTPPVRRNLGPFMTPQIWVNRPAQRVPILTDVKTRASIGGEGVQKQIMVTSGSAQRVRIVPPWKMQDIVLSGPEKSRPHVAENKKQVTEEERQAIITRRKLALQSSTEPLPTPGPRLSTFPPPIRSGGRHPHSLQGDLYTPGEDKDEDEETMLKRMKMKVDNVRRKSEIRKMRKIMKEDGSGGSGGGIATSNQARKFSLLATELGDQIGQLHLHDVNGDGHDGDLPGRIVSSKGPTVSTATSLTPRFDGIREMFRHQRLPREPPQTPRFTGMRKMFQHPPPPAKTPCFRGVKEMFDKAPPEEDEGLGSSSGSDDHRAEKAFSDEDDVIQGTNSKEPEHIAFEKPRRAPKRAGNTTTPVNTNEVGEARSGRDTSGSRSKKSAAVVAPATEELASNETVVHKSVGRTKGKAIALEEECDREGLALQSDGRVAPGGKGGRGATKLDRKQSVPHSDNEHEDGKTKMTRKARSVENSSDTEATSVPKARGRRGRAVKGQIPQSISEDTVVEAEDDVDGHLVLKEAKPARSKKGRVKVEADVQTTPDETDEESQKDVPSSEVEVVTSGLRKPKGNAKRGGTTTKKPLGDDSLGGDKENAREPSKPLTGKMAASSGKVGRPRKTPVSAAGAAVLDVPAKRTRSRK